MNRSGSPHNLVIAENLIKRFNGFTAVDGISFQVNAGECFGILGPNGAGKTSTVRMIYGFSPISGGTLHIFGIDITRYPRKIKARIGVCLQENSLDPDFTVFKNLTVYARYYDISTAIATERADQLLKFVGLFHKKEALISELSGGMMRRLVVARALINEPDLLVLDEPTTGLDPQSRHQIWERLEELKRKGLSILLTTHYMDEAAYLCDRLVIMDHGRILVEGSPKVLIDQYIGSHVIEVTKPDKHLVEFVKSHNLTYDELTERVLIYPQDNKDIYQYVTDHFCGGGCLLRTASLEDVFLKLTGRELRE